MHKFISYHLDMDNLSNTYFWLQNDWSKSQQIKKIPTSNFIHLPNMKIMPYDWGTVAKTSAEPVN